MPSLEGAGRVLQGTAARDGGDFRNRLNSLGNFWRFRRRRAAALWSLEPKTGLQEFLLAIPRGAIDRAKRPQCRRFGCRRVWRGPVETGFLQRVDEVGKPLLGGVAAKF